MASLTLTQSQNAGGEAARNHIQKYLFIGGLRESLRLDVLKAKTISLADALKEASKSELIHKKQGKIFSIEEELEESNEPDLDDEEIAAINHRRMKMGKRPFKKRFGNRNTTNEEVKCYNCNRMGHIAKNCNAPRRRQIRAIDDGEATETESMEQPQPIMAIHDQLDFW